MRRLVIPRADFDRTREDVLRSAVDAALMGADEPTAVQNVVVLGLNYLNGVMMDGHLLYLFNCGVDEAQQTVSALGILGADYERSCLLEALALYSSSDIAEHSYNDVPDDVAAAVDEVNQRLYASFGARSDNLEMRLSRYVEQHLADFIELV